MTAHAAIAFPVPAQIKSIDPYRRAICPALSIGSTRSTPARRTPKAQLFVPCRPCRQPITSPRRLCLRTYALPKRSPSMNDSRSWRSAKCLTFSTSPISAGIQATCPAPRSDNPHRAPAMCLEAAARARSSLRCASAFEYAVAGAAGRRSGNGRSGRLSNDIVSRAPPACACSMRDRSPTNSTRRSRADRSGPAPGSRNRSGGLEGLITAR